MSSVFRPTTVDDEPRVIELLTRVFSMSRDSPFVQLPLLRWKFWEPRADCTESRSFVMERDGRLVAHVGLWPVTVGAERGVQMIDWASDPQTPGVGVSALQRILKLYDFVYSIGGSDVTRSILPKFGFRTVGEALTWVRPIRPVRHTWTQPRDRKFPLRLARNLLWSVTPLGTSPRGWSLDGPGVGIGVFAKERGDSFFQYLKKCPVGQCLQFQMQRDGRPEGFFALSLVREQARVAGVWLQDSSAEHWRAAFSLAQEAARQHSGATEVIARACAEGSAQGAAEAGMRVRSRTPLFLYRKKATSEPLALQYQLCDDDSVFL